MEIITSGQVEVEEWLGGLAQIKVKLVLVVLAVAVEVRAEA
jgi:hypothetical protein